MTKIVVTALVFSIALVACAINAKAETGERVYPEYRTVLKDCGAKWRNRAEKTEKGRDAWQTFRKSCVLESGFVSKKDR